MNLTIADLKVVMQIIDVVTQRGAVRANEMKVVGDLYEKVRVFVETVEKQEQANNTDNNNQQPPPPPQPPHDEHADHNMQGQIVEGHIEQGNPG